MKFFHHIESFFKKAFGSANWAQTASSTLILIGPAIQTMLQMFAGTEVASEAGAVISEIQVDLGVASALLKQVQNGDTTVSGRLSSVLGSVVSNLDGLLTAGHIKDPALLTKVQASVKLVSEEILAIMKVLPTYPSSPATTKA